MIRGGGGDDELDGDEGSDKVYGEKGDDALRVHARTARDRDLVDGGANATSLGDECPTKITSSITKRNCERFGD